ncbi:putative FmdB family regulatory protein [Desulfobaculum xiamenense]|uniref:Putative FmdB family regulatory protein n=1 Tax=Desulfobaculum xiamenense TaxID=995050 RepID=A0A846QQV9_9BACT|nr:zinc ribbon domain-containing protein [Desulfobaculum xiamenense]NJB67775.1 putative FmdB family regulatory protein [Desulfobaculum xiamenense]
MPLFEYECEKCGAQFEELVALEAPAPVCPECSSSATRKLISATTIHFEAASPLDRKPDAKVQQNVQKAMKRKAVAAAACPGKAGGGCSGCGGAR